MDKDKFILEKQIEKILSAADVYRGISQTNNKNIILSGLKLLNDLGITDEIRIRDWLISFNKNKRDDSQIANAVGYSLFLVLFDKTNLESLHLRKNLGLSFLDLYFQKTKSLKSPKIKHDPNIESYEKCLLDPFRSMRGELLLAKEVMKVLNEGLIGKEKEYWDNISNLDWSRGLNYYQNQIGLDEDIMGLIQKGNKIRQNSFFLSSTDYSRAKEVYKKSLFLTFEKWKKIKEGIDSKPDIKSKFEKGVKDEETIPLRMQLAKYVLFVDLLNDLVSYSNFLICRQKRKCQELELILNQRFPIKEGLTQLEVEQLYQKISDFEYDLLNQIRNGKSGESIHDFNYRLLAFKGHYAQLLKVLKGMKFPGKDELLSKIYTHYGYFTTQKAKYFNKAMQLDKNNFKAYYELAKYYEETNNKQKALENWGNLVKFYFTRVEEKNFKKFGNSKTEVGKIEDPSYLFEDLILKKSKNDLSKEYKITSLVYQVMPNKETTSKPVAYIKESDGTSYIILRKANTPLGENDRPPTLVDIISNLPKLEVNEGIISRLGLISKEEIIENFKLTYFKKVIDILLDIQTFGESLENQICQYDYSAKLEFKLEKLFPKNKTTVYENLSFLTEYLNKLPQHFGHCDFNAGNILITEDKNKEDHFCIIDYEKVGLVNKYFDLVYLLEQEQLNTSLTDKKSLVQYFREKIKDETPLKEVMKIYDHNALFVNLILGGTCSEWTFKGEEYEQRKRKHLIRAKELLGKMEKDYGYNLSYLKNVLTDELC